MRITRGSSQLLSKVVSGGGSDFSIPSPWLQAPYGPGSPVQTIAGQYGAEIPRTIDYPIGVNTTLTPRTGYGLMPFAQIYSAYAYVTECKLPVWLITREMTSFVPHLVDSDGNEIDDHPYKWMAISPDRKTPFAVWLTRLLKSSLIYDAPAVYLKEDKGKIDELHYIDGSTLFVIVDQFGNTPLPEPIDQYVSRLSSTSTSTPTSSIPSESGTSGPTTLPEFTRRYLSSVRDGKAVPDKVPAYTQIIKGTPFSWWSSDQVWYMPQQRAIDSPYGESFIEAAWAWINIIANITSFELAHYRTGNMPEGFITVPPDWTGGDDVDKLMTLEKAFNDRMIAGGATERNRLRLFPDGTRYQQTKRGDNFPDLLYKQAGFNVLHSIGVPPSEMGDVPGGGLGGKGFKEGAAADLSRNTLNPKRAFINGLFNFVLQRDVVDDAEFALDYPTEEIDADKLKTSVYEGMAHGTFSLNDALGQLNYDPVGDPDDPNNAANKHMIIAGTAIYVIEDMQTQNGMAVPTFTGKPAGQTGGAPVGPETVAEQDGAEHSPEDMKTLKALIQNIRDKGTLTNKTYSVPSSKPSGGKSAETVKKAAADPLYEQMKQSFIDTAIRIDDQLKKSSDTGVRFSQPSVEYTAYATETNQHCSLCAHFIPETAGDVPHCTLVEGAISPNGWCKLFEKALSSPSDRNSTSMAKADATHSDGAMIAVMIPTAAANQLRRIAEGLKLPSAARLELPESMHVTLAFLPDANAAQAQRSPILDSLVSLSVGVKPLQGKIQGFGVFNGQDGMKVLFALLDEPQLPFLRTAVCKALDDIGVPYGRDYGFVPHITMAYFPENFNLPSGFEVPDIPVAIGAITYAVGDDYTSIPFGTVTKLAKHCGVCPEDDDYLGAPISREMTFNFPEAHHANDIEIVAAVPDGLPPKPMLFKPEGGEIPELQEFIGGPQYVREEAAYLLDRALNFFLVPVAYVTDSYGEAGTVIAYSPGAQPGKPFADYDPGWIEKAAVLDFISCQQDRGSVGHNTLTHPDEPDRPLIIDNGLSFPVRTDLECNSGFINAFAGQPLSGPTLAALVVCKGDAASWTDIAGLVGAPAAQNARARVATLLANKVIMPAVSTSAITGSSGL